MKVHEFDLGSNGLLWINNIQEQIDGGQLYQGDGDSDDTRPDYLKMAKRLKKRILDAINNKQTWIYVNDDEDLFLVETEMEFGGPALVELNLSEHPEESLATRKDIEDVNRAGIKIVDEYYPGAGLDKQPHIETDRILVSKYFNDPNDPRYGGMSSHYDEYIDKKTFDIHATGETPYFVKNPHPNAGCLGRCKGPQGVAHFYSEKSKNDVEVKYHRDRNKYSIRLVENADFYNNHPNPNRSEKIVDNLDFEAARKMYNQLLEKEI